jgi:DNA-directed RNA polymerase subunit M/transcription elongation factor TFIIS
MLILGQHYTETQRRTALPPPCPRCGSRETVPYWRETQSEDAERIWTATAFKCMDCLGQ